MGDADTLKSFVQYCKAYYPADHYALILSNHGGGVRKRSVLNDSEGLPVKAVCWDDTSGNNEALYTAEITDVLTDNESVDLLGFDACLMGTVEVAWQYRPGNGSFNAQVMVASAANEYGDGWDYYNIFKRLQNRSGSAGTADVVTDDGNDELYYSPASLTAAQFAVVIVEEQYDSAITEYNDQSQTLSCYDLTAVDTVKSAVDNMAVAIGTNSTSWTNLVTARGSGSDPQCMHYFSAYSSSAWAATRFLTSMIYAPYMIQNMAQQKHRRYVMKLIPWYFFPLPELIFRVLKKENMGLPFFSQKTVLIFLHNTGTILTRFAVPGSYGNISWCADGATEGNSIVEKLVRTS